MMCTFGAIMVYLKLLFQIHNLINGVSHTFIFSEGENIIAKHIIYRQVYIVAKHIVLIDLQVAAPTGAEGDGGREESRPYEGVMWSEVETSWQ